MLYPDDTMFYGEVYERLPTGICTYMSADNSYIYGLLNRRGDSIFILDEQITNTLQLVLIRQELFQKLIDYEEVDQHYLVE